MIVVWLLKCLDRLHQAKIELNTILEEQDFKSIQAKFC